MLHLIYLSLTYNYSFSLQVKNDTFYKFRGEARSYSGSSQRNMIYINRISLQTMKRHSYRTSTCLSVACWHGGRWASRTLVNI